MEHEREELYVVAEKNERQEAVERVTKFFLIEGRMDKEKQR